MKGFQQTNGGAWSSAWQDKQFRWRLIGALLVFSIFPWKADDYFQWIQQREGIQLHDFILSAIPVFNVSYLIFAIIYASVIYLIVRLIPNPKAFLWFAWAFNIETLFRFASIYLIALEPPKNIIELHDPLAELFIYGDSLAITKDLFFSGHTATMVFVCLFLPTQMERRIAIGLSVILAGLLLIQHVHYSIDVLFAPFITWVSVRIAKSVI